MSNVLCANTYKLRAVAVDHGCVAILGSVCNIPCERHTEQIAPFLELLAQVGVLDEGVCSSVVGHKAGILAVKAWVHGLDLRTPLSRGFDDLAVCAARVSGAGTGSWATGYTTCCHSRVASCGLDNVGIGGHHDVSHHASRAAASDEDLGWVGGVRLDDILDHVVEALVVAARIVRETLCGVDFPAVVVFFGRREDGDEALLL